MKPRLTPGWTVLAPRKEVFYRFDSRYRSDYPPICLNPPQDLWDVWHCLARIPWDGKRPIISPSQAQANSPVRIGPEMDDANASNNRLHPNLSLSLLERLPAEILALIVGAENLDQKDIVNLGLSSRTLWQHVLLHIRLDYVRDSGSLIGTEIACVCDVRTHLPQAFRRDTYQLIDKIIRRRMRQRELTPLFSNKELDRNPLNYRLYRAGSTALEDWLQMLNEACEQESGDGCDGRQPQWNTGRLAAEMKDACAVPPFVNPTDSRCWILRNQTTHEYVRCRPIPPGKGETSGSQIHRASYIDHPSSNVVTIQEALLWRIQCSDASAGLYGLNHLGKYFGGGTWAGHCFDIVPRETHDHEMRMSTVNWFDITDDICVDMVNVKSVVWQYRAKVKHSQSAWYAVKGQIQEAAEQRLSVQSQTDVSLEITHRPGQVQRVKAKIVERARRLAALSE